MNAAFRSHLMQQFVSAARHQARTPIALMGWVQHEDGEQQQQQQSSSFRSSSSACQQLSSIGTPTSHASSAPTSSGLYQEGMDPFLSHTTTSRRCGTTSRDMSTTLANTRAPEEEPSDSNDTEEPPEEDSPGQTNENPSANNRMLSSDLALSFQSLLLTRRTTSKFRTEEQEDDANPSKEFNRGSMHPPLLTPEQYRVALDRAVAAGRAAPNHKRTEPFRFRRLLAPSESTERLAEIAEQVYLRQKQLQQQQQQLNNNNNVFDSAVVQAAALRKREKWRQIPAFLVTLVSTQRNNEHAPPPASRIISNPMNTDNNPYDPLPYTPPASERALEDYAAACAATQNLLLSLHAQGLASKWATGPVIRTEAFRELVQAEPDDRVVALVMIGQAVDNSSKPRRYRRALEGDVLRDL